MSSRAIGLLVCIVLVSPALLSAQVVVRKAATEANPSIRVVSFEGSPAVGKRLRDTLARCDWFTVVGARDEADYLVRGRHTRSGAESLVLEVSTSSGNSFRVSHTAITGRADEVVFGAVDGILRKIFGIPGLCSSRIAFVVGGKNNLKEIYTCRFDGTDMKRLTHNGSISTEPSWGSDGGTLVYTVYENNATSVVLVDTVRNRQRRLSRFPGLNSGADLSPDGRWAALSLSRDNRIELYLLSIASGRLHRLTQDLAVESSPCWSPDGTRLCYVSDRAGKPRLYLMPARGGKSVPLLSEWTETVSPDWSPVSNRICYATRVGRQYAIAYVDMKDPRRRPTIVTKAAGDWEAPAWAPDGRHIVCSRRVGGKRSLYMIDTWHGKLVQVTRGGDHSLPSWSPITQRPSR